VQAYGSPVQQTHDADRAAEWGEAEGGKGALRRQVTSVLESSLSLMHEIERSTPSDNHAYWETGNFAENFTHVAEEKPFCGRNREQR
jgi:hypothetical protein